MRVFGMFVADPARVAISLVGPTQGQPVCASVQRIERPYYTVFHSSTPNSTQQTTFAGLNVILMNNAGGLANGQYVANRVQVIHTYLNVFSPTTQILDRWERTSSANGYSATPASTNTQQTASHIPLVITNGGLGVAAGTYFVDRYLVTSSFLDVFSPGTQILNNWGRFSSNSGISAANPQDGATWAAYNFNINQNAAAVTTQTYCVHVTGTYPMNQAVDVWIPAPPSQLRTAYSLHLYDPTIVGITEPTAMQNGLSVFPSPTTDVLNILITSQLDGSARLAIIDGTGREVLFAPALTSNGRFTLDVSGLSSGVYVARVSSGTQSFTGRFIKR